MQLLQQLLVGRGGQGFRKFCRQADIISDAVSLVLIPAVLGLLKRMLAPGSDRPVHAHIYINLVSHM